MCECDKCVYERIRKDRNGMQHEGRGGDKDEVRKERDEEGSEILESDGSALEC